MDQCITKYVLHLDTMDDCSIRCCTNTTLLSTWFTI